MEATDHGIPSGSVILNVLHIVEYIDEDGDVWKVDLSHDNTEEGDLATGKYFELAEWAKMLASAPILAEMVQDYVYGGEDDDDEDGDAVVAEA